MFDLLNIFIIATPKCLNLCQDRETVFHDYFGVTSICSCFCAVKLHLVFLLTKRTEALAISWHKRKGKTKQESQELAAS